MTDFAQLLDISRIQCKQTLSSKKRALESLAALLAPACEEDHSQMDILDSLSARERIGGTGLGHGIALPHGRMPNLQKPLAAIMTLEEGVDFDAPDGEPVDILVAVLVAKDCESEHLHILAGLAKLFIKEGFRQQIRDCNEPGELLALFTSTSTESD